MLPPRTTATQKALDLGLTSNTKSILQCCVGTVMLVSHVKKEAPQLTHLYCQNLPGRNNFYRQKGPPSPL